MRIHEHKREPQNRPGLDLSGLDLAKVPRHVAIIMDGNGRWAKKRGLPRSLGHREGVKTVNRIVRIASDLGLKVLTLYAFSTENWKRPGEVGILMDLLVEFRPTNSKNSTVTGPGSSSSATTKACPRGWSARSTRPWKRRGADGLIVNIALNYGGRGELVQAVKALAAGKGGAPRHRRHRRKYAFQGPVHAGHPGPGPYRQDQRRNAAEQFPALPGGVRRTLFHAGALADFTEQDFVDMLAEYQSRGRRFGGL